MQAIHNTRSTHVSTRIFGRPPRYSAATQSGDPAGVESIVTDDNKAFLDGAYTIKTPADTSNFYDGWAASYEREIRDNGYATPDRCAEALANLVADKQAPLLDLGCGTGLSGEAFKARGFTTIDGSDFSDAMLAYAAAKPGLYRKLTTGDLNNPLPAAAGEYANMAAVGVFSPSHAPAEMLNTGINLLTVGGYFVFSLNDHTLEDPSFETYIQALVDSALARVVFKEYGPHLPGKDMQALVYVLQRAG